MRSTGRFAARACGLVVLAALSGSCTSDDVVKATAILVTVQSDLPVGDQFGEIKVAIFSQKGELASEHTFELTASDPKRGQVRLPFSFGVQKKGANRFTIAVTGYPPDAQDNPIVEQRFTIDFKENKTLGLDVFLTHSCYQIVCGDEQNCYADASGETGSGVCDDISRPDLDEVEPGEELPDAGDVPEADGGEAGAGPEADAAVEEAGSGGGAGRAGGGAGRSGSGGVAGGYAGSGGTGGAAGSCGSGSCSSDEVCIDGQCECNSALTPYFRDEDADGFGDPSRRVCSVSGPPSGYVGSSDDCCDSDVDAFPGQTEYFTVSMNCAAGDYDYDCDGTSEHASDQHATGNCCMSWQNGWDPNYPIPECGAAGTVVLCNTNTCVPEGAVVLQDCH